MTLTSKSHFTGLLITDVNRFTSIYAIGSGSGIKEISIGDTGLEKPTKSGNTVTIPLTEWSSFIFITNDDTVTVS